MPDFSIVRSSVDAARAAVVVHNQEIRHFFEDEYRMDFVNDVSYIPSSVCEDVMEDAGYAHFTSVIC